MRRRKRFSIKLVALGLAVAAISASPAQARLDEGFGVPKQSEPTWATGSDDRGVNLMLPAPYEPTVGQGSPTVGTASDDRAVDRRAPWPSTPPSASSDDGFEIGTLSALGISGFVLLLGVGGAFLAVHRARKSKLASA